MLGRIDEALLHRVAGPLARRLGGVSPDWVAAHCFTAAVALFLIACAAAALLWALGPPVDALWLAGNLTWLVVTPVIFAFLRAFLRLRRRGEAAFDALDRRLATSRRVALLALPIFVPWAWLFGIPAEVPFLARFLAWLFFLVGLYAASAAALARRAPKGS